MFPSPARLQQSTGLDAYALVRVAGTGAVGSNPIGIDRGIPEPIRTAVKQGVSWWAEAFDRAGLNGAFRVDDLPDGADAMDAQYNGYCYIGYGDLSDGDARPPVKAPNLQHCAEWHAEP